MWWGHGILEEEPMNTDSPVANKTDFIENSVFLYIDPEYFE